MSPRDFFDAASDPVLALIFEHKYPWEALAKLEDWMKELKWGVQEGEISSLATVDRNVSIGKGTVVEPGVVIKGPAFIGRNCEIRAGAYIRGNVYVGDNSVIGHGAEDFCASASATHTLILLTYGQKEFQLVKLRQSGLQAYFKEVIVTNERSKKKELMKLQARYHSFLVFDNSELVLATAKKLGLPYYQFKSSLASSAHYCSSSRT